jgi:hypothetical protein
MLNKLYNNNNMSNFFIIYILKKLENKFNITLELEIIKLICNYYNYNLLRIKLKKYNLFELIYLLNKLELLFDFNLSKKVIINKFVNIKLDYNINFSNYKFINNSFKVEGNNIKWRMQKIARQIFNIVILNNINIFEIYSEDIIKIKNKKYIIFIRLYQYLLKNINKNNENYDKLYVILENLKTNIKELISVQQLIDKFENEDITYIKSNYLNYYNR